MIFMKSESISLFAGVIFVAFMILITTQSLASQGSGQDGCLNEISRRPDATSYHLKQMSADELFKTHQYALAACWYKASLAQFSREGFGDNKKDEESTTWLRNHYIKNVSSSVELKKNILKDRIRMCEIYEKVQNRVKSDPVLSGFRSDLPRLKTTNNYGSMIDRAIGGDPDAVTLNSAQLLAECYYDLKDYTRAERWFKLILEFHSGTPPFERLLIDSGRGHASAVSLAKKRVSEFSKKKQVAQQERDQLVAFRASIKKKKDIGDHVCSVKDAWDGYVENVHKSKLQVRVQVQTTSSGNAWIGTPDVTTVSDQLIWVKFNEVGLCDYNFKKVEAARETMKFINNLDKPENKKQITDFFNSLRQEQ